jgi:hypothetical protein
MNDRWTTKAGKRWNKTERDRVSRRFRYHVRTTSNPRGRIHREGCFWHPEVEAEAHHIDYTKPFVVVWAGGSCGCHRRVDHGSLKVPKKAIFDYTSLVSVVARPGGQRHGPVKDSKACTCGRRRRNEPHRNGCPRETTDAPF